MKCPHDGTKLVINDTLGVTHFNCAVCHGEWVTHRSIEAIQTQLIQFSADDLYLLLRTRPSLETLLSCPAGCGKLTASRLISIDLDWCSDCKGVWFDTEELKNALDIWRQKEDAKRAWTSLDTISAVLATLTEGLNE